MKSRRFRICAEGRSVCITIELEGDITFPNGHLVVWDAEENVIASFAAGRWLWVNDITALKAAADSIPE